MTTESKLFFDKTAYQVVDGNIVYASDLNNPLTAVETGQTAVVNVMQTGAGVLSATDTGIVNAYVLNPTAVLTEYSDGQMVWLKPGNTNTGASTLNVSSLGAKAIRSVVRTALVGGELLAGYWFKLKYSSTLDAFVIVSERGKTDVELEKTIAGGTGIEVVSTDDTLTISVEDGGIDTEQLAAESVTQEKIDPSVSFGPKAIQKFDTAGSHTYTPTPGATVAVVEVVGGGAEGGNGGASYSAGGGGEGGYSRKRISLSGVTSVAVTVGAGGAGGGTTGANGGTSSFGGYCSATGGVGSVGDTAFSKGGLGGAGIGGDDNRNGSPGATCQNAGLGGMGGGNGGGLAGSTEEAGGNGLSPGAGGAGGAATANGGDGEDGIVIVTEY